MGAFMDAAECDRALLNEIERITGITPAFYGSGVATCAYCRRQHQERECPGCGAAR